jgi:hypothetical protein
MENADGSYRLPSHHNVLKQVERGIRALTAKNCQPVVGKAMGVILNRRRCRRGGTVSFPLITRENGAIRLVNVGRDDLVIRAERLQRLFRGLGFVERERRGAV